MSTSWESLCRNVGNCRIANVCADRLHGLMRMLNTCVASELGDLSVFTTVLCSCFHCDMLPHFLITPGTCSLILASCAPSHPATRTVPVKKVFWASCIIHVSELSYVYFLEVLNFLGFLFVLRLCLSLKQNSPGKTLKSCWMMSSWWLLWTASFSSCWALSPTKWISTYYLGIWVWSCMAR